MAKQIGKVTKEGVYKYIAAHSTKLHPVQEELIEMTRKHEKANMLSSLHTLHLLGTLMKGIRAKKVLDIGVFTGASTLTAGLSIPDDGKVVALDISEDFTNLAKPFWSKASIAHKIDLRIAPALESLNAMISNGESGSFDFAYIDADKENYSNYFDSCVQLLRSGGIIMFDNTLWSYRVVDPDFQDDDTNGIRESNKRVFESDKVHNCMLDVGDGITIAFVL